MNVDCPSGSIIAYREPVSLVHEPRTEERLERSPTTVSSREYYLHRRLIELAAMERAMSARAREAHQALADEYERLASK